MAADPRRVKELFVALLDLPDSQARQAFLESECAADADLRQRLEALLKAHENPASALERPLAAVEPPADPPAENSPPGPGLGETSFYHGPGEGVGSIVAGKYKLLEALGQGGMGDVFMAQQTAPVKRLVALKLIKPGMDSRQVLARFEAERQALALMDHPNIAKVLDAGATESGRPFFVMELVKGVPITRFCDERQLLDRYSPRRTVIAGIALFRLRRYGEALATLRKYDVPMLSRATGMFISPWNLLIRMAHRNDGFPVNPSSEVTILTYHFDPVDLLVRAMCHHHLGDSREAKACLNEARGTWGKYGYAINDDQRPFLREAESLIEGKPRP